jgi:hypothetical protein
MEPLWSGCLPPVTAFFDPPYLLSTGNGLSAFAPMTGPAPGPTAEPITASATATSSATPVVPPSSSIVKDPQISSITRVDPQDTLATRSIVPSSPPITEVQTVRILTMADSSILSLTLNLPASLASDPGESNSEAAAPVASDPGESNSAAAVPVASDPDPSQTDPLRTPAGQFSVTTPLVTKIGGIVMTIGGFATDTNASAAKGTETGSGNYNGTMYTGGVAETNSKRKLWDLGLLLGVGVLSICCF